MAGWTVNGRDVSLADGDVSCVGVSLVDADVARLVADGPSSIV